MSFRTVALSTAAIAAIVLLAPVEASAAKQCRPGGHLHHASSDPSVSKQDALRDARSSWKSFTELEYGSGWGNFKNARMKKTSCHNQQAGWVCNIEGNPCKTRYRRSARK